MIEIINEAYPKARKEYGNDAWEYVRELNGQYLDKMNALERQLCVEVKAGLYKKILKGERYVKQINKIDGDIITYRASVSLHDLCCRYDLFPEQ